MFVAIVHLWPLRYIICSTRSSWKSKREGNSVPKTLAQVGYSFLLGIVLSLSYLGSENFVLPVLGHFLFNALNDTVPSMFLSYSMDTAYYIWNAVLGVFALLYAIGIAIVMKRRKTHVS